MATAALTRPLFRGIAAGALFCATAVGTARSAQPAGPAVPPDVVRIGEDRYRVGKAVADLKARTVECAGKLNMRRGLVEYLAVAPGGKRHESLLLLDVRPIHLQVGLILLGLEPKGGLRFQGDPQAPKGSAVDIRVSWPRDGKTVRVPATELVWDIRKKRPMERDAWVFSGSTTNEAGFVAEQELSLIATYRDPAAVVNNALLAGADDTTYKVNERIAPPLGTPVTVTISPRGAAPSEPAPPPEGLSA